MFTLEKKALNLKNMLGGKIINHRRNIGGEIEIDLPYMISSESAILENTILFYDSGRSALREILKNEKIGAMKFLLPSYLCESILFPFDNLKVQYSFYEIKEDLSINFDKIFNMVEHYDAIYIIDYFGFSPEREKIEELKKKDFFIIEDLSHVGFIPILSNLYQPFGDVVYGSLRKLFPVADGGFIYKTNQFFFNKKMKSQTVSSLYKMAGKFFKSLYLKNNIIDVEIERKYLELLGIAEKKLNDQNEIRGISEISFLILDSQDFNSILNIRRENYNFLYENILCLSDIPIFEPLFHYNNNMLMPYMFPLKIKNGKRNIIRESLRKVGIFTPVLWDLSDYKFDNDFPGAVLLSEQILCLPIDQRYTREDMQYIVDNFKKILDYDN